MAIAELAPTQARLTWRLGDETLQAGYDSVGVGPDMLLLPALSSITMRAEMHPLAERLKDRFHCIIPGWPGFDDQSRITAPLTPDVLRTFLDELLPTVLRRSAVGVAAGHAATYLAEAALRHPRLFDRLVLVAPTWRGPLPTMMGETRRSLYDRLRRTMEQPLIGHALYRVNLSRPVVAAMLRAHVFADPSHVTDDVLKTKLSVRSRRSARFATAAFVSGALDPILTRDAFLGLFASALPPTLLIRPRSAPRKSGAEMDALGHNEHVKTVSVPGALAAHEEYPDEVGAAIAAFSAQV